MEKNTMKMTTLRTARILKAARRMFIKAVTDELSRVSPWDSGWRIVLLAGIYMFIATMLIWIWSAV